MKYRPTYPPGVLDLLIARFGLLPGSVVADVGSGTGIFSRLLLDRGFTVKGVEPNAAMREASLDLGDGFTAIDATAEATGLVDSSVDLVVATQAFHWFDAVLFRKECERILRGKKPVALIWNERCDKESPFSIAYEALIARYSVDYLATRHRSISQALLAEFFAPAEMSVDSFPNEQRFGWDGFVGRLSSSSYAPAEGHANYEPMIDALRVVYDEFAVDGVVTLKYDCRVYLAQLNHRPLTK